MSRLNKEALFIDLYGTLLVSIQCITNSFKYAFNKIGKSMPDKPIRNFIGPPLSYSLAEFFSSDEDIEKVISYYREYYIVKGINECKLYDNVLDMLSQLKSRGYKLYVATSKPTELAKSILSRYGADKYFIKIYGAENDSKRGSKNLVLEYALADSGEDKSNSLMIGDSLWDREGAIYNEVDFAAVLYGFGDRETIDYPDNYFTAETVLDIINYLPTRT